jgi:hypothetical protein
MKAFLGTDQKVIPQGMLRVLALALALALAFGGTLSSARADDEPSWLTKALGLRTETPVSPPFVQQTRPSKTDYVPVHTPRVGPTSKPMTKDQVVSQERSLESSRRAHDKIAGRSNAAPPKSVADGLEQGADRKPKTQDCTGLTCANPSLLPAQPGREYR